jgi:uncharacterized protein YecE (DUF72 family)
MEQLREFIEVLPRGIKHAIEFRHPSWYSDDVFSALDREDLTICLHDMEGSELERSSIGTFRYVRFHGGSTKYAGGYGPQRLADWAHWLIREQKPAFVYFNNDIGGQAPRDATALRNLVLDGAVSLSQGDGQHEQYEGG